MKRLPGKHVEVFEVHTKLKPISVEIRLDRKRSVFFAEVCGERFENSDLVVLRRELSACARAREDAAFTFRPFIEYRIVEDTDHALIGLDFEVIELSPKSKGKPRLVRRSSGPTRRYFPRDGIRLAPFTPERLQVLEDIRTAILALRTKLHEYLDVPEEVVGDALDWLSMSKLFPRLLTPPTVRPAE